MNSTLTVEHCHLSECYDILLNSFNELYLNINYYIIKAIYLNNFQILCAIIAIKIYYTYLVRVNVYKYLLEVHPPLTVFYFIFKVNYSIIFFWY